MNVNEDFYAAAEKILSDIELIFRKDPKLQSFEIIPVVTNENKSPVYHVEHCLGLESWCIPHIFCHAYQNVINMRQNKGCRDLKRLNTLLMGALMINPEITTFWNMRKELINSGKLDAHFELHFTAIILTRKPKSADVFLHRKWILKKLLHGVAEDFGIIANEINICEVAADRYSNNYHAWTHRAWCLMQGIPVQNLSQFYQQELSRLEVWISKHVSDYSGMQYRQQVLRKIFQFVDTQNSESIADYLSSAEESVEEFLTDIGLKQLNVHSLKLPFKMQLCIYELVLNTGFIKDFVGHEALWYHRRFVFNFIKESLVPKDLFDTNKCWGFKDTNHLNCDGIPLEKNQKLDPCCLTDKFTVLLSIYEDNFLRKYSSELTDSRERLYAERHVQWLGRYLKFKLPYNLDLLKGNFDMSINFV